MQALILVGGEGTRLRPLTTVVPKPVIQLVDRPFMAYMLEWLARHGVDRAVMSCGYKPEGIKAVLGDGTAHGVELTYVEEPTPMGTGGAMKYCEDLLEDEFLMLNGDVLTDIDVTAQIAQHRATGARGTLGLYPVADPSAYGLVRLNDDGSVRGFLEKPRPEEIDTDLISAGIYMLSKDVLAAARARPAGIDRARRVPPAGRRRAVRLPRSRRLLDGHRHAASATCRRRSTSSRERSRRKSPRHVDPGAHVDGELEGTVLIERGARIDPGARISGPVVIGAGASVGPGSTVESSVVLSGASIGSDCTLRDCIVAEEATIDDGCELSGYAVVGRDAYVGHGNVLGAGTRVSPGDSLPARAGKV